MVWRIFSRAVCASLLCFCVHAYADAEAAINSEFSKTNAIGSTHITVMRFNTKWSYINKDGKAWQRRDTDASYLARELFDLLGEQKASLDLDVSVDLKELNMEYTLESAESDIYYASGTNGQYSLVRCETPIGRRLVACLEQMQVNGNAVLCMRLFFRDTSLVGREEFKPFPALDGGKPLIRSSVSQDLASIGLMDGREYKLLSYGANSTDLEINICRIQRTPLDE